MAPRKPPPEELVSIYSEFLVELEECTDPTIRYLTINEYLWKTLRTRTGLTDALLKCQSTDTVEFHVRVLIAEEVRKMESGKTAGATKDEELAMEVEPKEPKDQKTCKSTKKPQKDQTTATKPKEVSGDLNAIGDKTDHVVKKAEPKELEEKSCKSRMARNGQRKPRNELEHPEQMTEVDGCSGAMMTRRQRQHVSVAEENEPDADGKAMETSKSKKNAKKLPEPAKPARKTAQKLNPKKSPSKQPTKPAKPPVRSAKNKRKRSKSLNSLVADLKANVKKSQRQRLGALKKPVKVDDKSAEYGSTARAPKRSRTDEISKDYSSVSDVVGEAEREASVHEVSDGEGEEIQSSQDFQDSQYYDDLYEYQTTAPSPLPHDPNEPGGSGLPPCRKNLEAVKEYNERLRNAARTPPRRRPWEMVYNGLRNEKTPKAKTQMAPKDAKKTPDIILDTVVRDLNADEKSDSEMVWEGLHTSIHDSDESGGEEGIGGDFRMGDNAESGGNRGVLMNNPISPTSSAPVQSTASSGPPTSSGTSELTLEDQEQSAITVILDTNGSRPSSTEQESQKKSPPCPVNSKNVEKDSNVSESVARANLSSHSSGSPRSDTPSPRSSARQTTSQIPTAPPTTLPPAQFVPTSSQAVIPSVTSHQNENAQLTINFGNFDIDSILQRLDQVCSEFAKDHDADPSADSPSHQDTSLQNRPPAHPINPSTPSATSTTPKPPSNISHQAEMQAPNDPSKSLPTANTVRIAAPHINPRFIAHWNPLHQHPPEKNSASGLFFNNKTVKPQATKSNLASPNISHQFAVSRIPAPKPRPPTTVQIAAPYRNPRFKSHSKPLHQHPPGTSANGLFFGNLKVPSLNAHWAVSSGTSSGTIPAPQPRGLPDASATHGFFWNPPRLTEPSTMQPLKLYILNTMVKVEKISWTCAALLSHLKNIGYSLFTEADIELREPLLTFKKGCPNVAHIKFAVKTATAIEKYSAFAKSTAGMKIVHDSNLKMFQGDISKYQFVFEASDDHTCAVNQLLFHVFMSISASTWTTSYSFTGTGIVMESGEKLDFPSLLTDVKYHAILKGAFLQLTDRGKKCIKQVALRHGIAFGFWSVQVGGNSQ